jgi:hypothetical protein
VRIAEQEHQPVTYVQIRGHQPAHCLQRCSFLDPRLGHGLPDGRERVHHGRADQRVPVREVAVQGRPADPGGLGDLRQRRCPVSGQH